MEIPIEHSSARKQRAQIFFSAKEKNRNWRQKTLYHNIAAERAHCVSLSILLTTIRQNMLLLISFRHELHIWETFCKYGKEMERMKFFCVISRIVCTRPGSKETAEHATREGQFENRLTLWTKFFSIKLSSKQGFRSRFRNLNFLKSCFCNKFHIRSACFNGKVCLCRRPLQELVFLSRGLWLRRLASLIEMLKSLLDGEKNSIENWQFPTACDDRATIGEKKPMQERKGIHILKARTSTCCGRGRHLKRRVSRTATS